MPYFLRKLEVVGAVVREREREREREERGGERERTLLCAPIHVYNDDIQYASTSNLITGLIFICPSFFNDINNVNSCSLYTNIATVVTALV